MLILVLLMAVAAAACAGAADVHPTSTPPQFDPTGSWVVVGGSMDGAPIPTVDGFPTTMTVGGGEIQGTAACNDYGGTLVIDDGVVSAEIGGSTAMGCREDVLAAEAAFFAALPRVVSGEIIADTLVLVGDQVRIEFVRRPELAFDALADQEWRLASLGSSDGTVAEAAGEAMLRLDADGTLTGTTGCRTLTGRFVVSAADIQVTELRADGECPPALSDQDGFVISVLERFTASVSGGRLVLTGQGNETLTYEAP